IIPKALALQHPERTVLWVNRPMAWIKRVLWPAVVLVEALGNSVLRLLGIHRGHSVAAPSRDALRFMVEQSALEGELGAEAGSVLEELFAFSELSAGEVMAPRVRVVGLPMETSASELRRLVRAAPHSRYPVYEGTLDGIVGVVLMRDVLRLLLEQTPLTAASVRPIPFVPATARLDVVLARMRRDKSQMAVVMDEQGGTAGIITTEDLFEEVVGKISDGEAGPAPVHEVDGELRAAGGARIAEVAERLGLERAHPEVDTVSGLVLSILDRPPERGDVVHWRSMELRVRSTEGRGVKEVAVRLTPPRDLPPKPRA
ncbi:MAG TPA: hemolysin family protein, partial [Polyangiales bacterium]|nr:hemolysin family protein [Polyangiales bacterium]